MLCLVADDSHGKYISYLLFGAAKETVMKDDEKPPKRRETKSQGKSWWLRPETLRIAFAVVRLVHQVAKLIDWLSR